MFSKLPRLDGYSPYFYSFVYFLAYVFICLYFIRLLIYSGFSIELVLIFNAVVWSYAPITVYEATLWYGKDFFIFLV